MTSEGAHPEFKKYVIRLRREEVFMDAPRVSALDYTEALIGEILYGESSDVLTKVGDLSFQHLRLDWAARDGFPLKELAAFDNRYAEVFPLLFDKETDALTFRTGPTASRDVLYIDELSLLPDHRGRRLGAFIVERLVRQYPTRWGVLVVRAAPEPYAEGEVSDWYERVHARPFPSSGELAQKRLRAYWAGFGFQRLGESAYMARSPHADANAIGAEGIT